MVSTLMMQLAAEEAAALAEAQVKAAAAEAASECCWRCCRGTSVVVEVIKGTESVVVVKLAIDLLAKLAAAGPPSSLRSRTAL